MIAPEPPTVGRIVHYFSHGSPPREDGSQAYSSENRAAIITEVHGTLESDDRPSPVWDVGLAVLNSAGVLFNEHVLQDEDQHTLGSCHWPARVVTA
ncbi:hypothetical protein [Streptomyces kronopolitis]|uniref:hypothetical protein n=1 Tax=Streptomyces kronopolitis TaxID=1612435 RepID=UPI00342028DB